jgi:hypothetical protein
VVPDPQPRQLLGYLKALQKAHDESGRWGWLIHDLAARSSGCLTSGGHVSAAGGGTSGGQRWHQTAVSIMLLPSAPEQCCRCHGVFAIQCCSFQCYCRVTKLDAAMKWLLV